MDFNFDDIFSDEDIGEITENPLDSRHESFKDMTDEEIEEFKQSEEYKTYSAEVHRDADIAPNMQGKTVQDVIGLSDLRARYGCHYTSIEHSEVETWMYDDIVANSPVMQQTLEYGEDILPTFKYLHQDLFYMCYKYNVKVRPESEVHVSSKFNRAVIEYLVNTPEYIALRQSCRMDQFYAAWATELLSEEALKIIEQALQMIKDLEEKKQKLRELLEKEEEMDEVIEEAEEIEELLERARQSKDSQAVAQYSQQMEDSGYTIQQLKALANKMAEECEELLEDDDVITEVSTQLGTAFTSASMEITEAGNIAQIWGMEAGETTRISFENKKQCIEHIRRRSKLKKITNELGRLKDSAIAEQKKKVKYGAVVIKSVTSGNRIEDTLPSDRANLAIDVMKPDFYRRMTDNQLLVYSKESSMEKNKGPIIVCVDTSGSMEGNQEIWSKSMAISVLEIAQMQKRDYACIHFSSTAHDPIIITKDEVAPQKIIDIAEFFDSGGTSFEPPLRNAMELIKDSRFKSADILFITDGESYLNDDFIKEFKRVKEDKEFRCIGVLVDCGRHSSCDDGSLKEFCDNIVTVSSIAELQDAESDINTAIFRTL